MNKITMYRKFLRFALRSVKDEKLRKGINSRIWWIKKEDEGEVKKINQKAFLDALYCLPSRLRS